MDPLTLGFAGVAGLLVLLLLGVHIGVALSLVGIAGMASIIGLDISVSMAASSIYHTLASYELITIPLFILMGYLASAGGISGDVFKSINDWLGRFKGGVGTSTIASCTAFGAVCGSSLVTASVFSRLCAPEMRKLGYDKRIAYGICASGGMIGMLIPPSILMVIYGVLAGESIGKLLIAGVTPGLLLMAAFALVVVAIAWTRPDIIRPGGPAEAVPLRRRLLDLLRIWQVWVVAIVIFGGIFGGVFNPTEAAAVASAFLILLLLFTRWREIPTLFPGAFRETAATTAMIFLVMGGASVFSHFLALTGMPTVVVEWLRDLQLSPLALIWAIVVFYALLGCFLDSISMLSITIPILNPLVQSMGMDPIWYAVVVIMAIESGLLTPPVGLNVYGAYAVAEKDVRLEDIFVGIIPFFLATWAVLALLIFVPNLTTALPQLMLGH